MKTNYESQMVLFTEFQKSKNYQNSYMPPRLRVGQPCGQVRLAAWRTKEELMPPCSEGGKTNVYCSLAEEIGIFNVINDTRVWP